MSTPSSPPTPAAPIPHDLPCMTCHNNLRTLPPTSRCPECGTPIPDSLTYYIRANTLDLHALFRAALCLALLPLLEALSYSGIYSWFTYQPFKIQFIHDTHLHILLPFLFPVAAFFGINWLTTVQPFRRAKILRRAFLAWPVLNLLLIPVILGADHFWISKHYPTLSPYAAICALSAAAFRTAFFIPFYLTVLYLLCRVAARLRRPWLATLAIWVFSLCALGGFLQTSSMVGSLCYIWAAYFAPVTTSFPRYFEKIVNYSNWFAPYIMWLSTIAPFLFWLLLAAIARRAAKYAPPAHPRGLLIDPHPSTPDPVAISAYRLPVLRLAAITLTLIFPMALIAIAPEVNLDRPLDVAVNRASQFATAAIALACLAAILLLAANRRPTLRHHLRAAAVSVLTGAAVLIHARVVVNAESSYYSSFYSTWIYTFLRWPVVLALLFAAHAFFINFRRQTSLTPPPRLSAVTFYLPFTILLVFFIVRQFYDPDPENPEYYTHPWPIIPTAVLVSLFLHYLLWTWTLFRPARPKPV